MSTRLDDLSDRFRPLAFELLARCVEAKIQVRIIDTLRTLDDQRKNIEKGVSWTLDSRHLTGDAIDLAPVAVLKEKNWAPDHPDWLVIGEIGEKLGLIWGGRWKHRDMGHFELKT